MPGGSHQSVEIDPAVWLGHYRVLNDLDFELTQTRRQLWMLRRKIRVARAVARKAGCDVEAMRVLREFEKVGPTVRTKRYAHLQSYVNWKDVGTAILRPEDRKTHQLWLASVAGRQAAFDDKKRDANPYAEDGEHAAAWLRGYESVNEPFMERYREIPATPKPLKIYPRRGRPQGRKNVAKGRQAELIRGGTPQQDLPGMSSRYRSR